jgi:undecaprenyl-diphosphatase
MTPKEKRFWTGAALVSAELLGTMVVFTGAVASLVFTIRPWMRKHKKLDLEVFDELKPHISTSNNRLMLGVTYLGKHQFLIPANLFLITYFLFIRKRTWFSIRVASVALSSLLLMTTLKHLFHRKRPLLPLLQPARGMSFPSGHAMMSISFYGLLIYIISHTIKNQPVKRTLIISLVLLIAVIGFSRIYLRVHYTSDVLAGYIIGLLWLLIALDVLSRLEAYNKQKAKQLTQTVAVSV